MTTGRVVDSYTNIQSVKMFAHHDREVDYAREAIENARRPSQRDADLHIMDVALTVLNGLLIVGVVGWAIALWAAGRMASVGRRRGATALTLRLNAMTGWIMWAVSSFFRKLGVVAEGMETIAQPITLTDKPDASRWTCEGRIEFEG